MPRKPKKSAAAVKLGRRGGMAQAPKGFPIKSPDQRDEAGARAQLREGGAGKVAQIHWASTARLTSKRRPTTA